MDDQAVIAGATRVVRGYKHALTELRARPRFGGSEEAQRFWLGCTHKERIAELERQISLGEAAIQSMRVRLAPETARR